MSQSVGGDETYIFSPDVVAGVAAIPVGAMDDVMGKTPRGAEARYAEPSTQTPDDKAGNIVWKAPGTNLEETLHDHVKKQETKSFKLTNKLMRTSKEHQRLVQQIQHIQKGRVPAGVKPFAAPESHDLEHQARRIECGTLVLQPDETWRDVKKNLVLQVQRNITCERRINRI